MKNENVLSHSQTHTKTVPLFFGTCSRYTFTFITCMATEIKRAVSGFFWGEWNGYVSAMENHKQMLKQGKKKNEETCGGTLVCIECDHLVEDNCYVLGNTNTIAYWECENRTVGRWGRSYVRFPFGFVQKHRLQKNTERWSTFFINKNETN